MRSWQWSWPWFWRLGILLCLVLFLFCFYCSVRPPAMNVPVTLIVLYIRAACVNPNKFCFSFLDFSSEVQLVLLWTHLSGMLLCVWFLIAKMFDQVCFDKCPETAMRILVKGHASCGMTRVQYKSVTCGSVYTFICQIPNIHVTAAKIFNVHQINKRAFSAPLYSNKDCRVTDFPSQHELTLQK